MMDYAKLNALCGDISNWIKRSTAKLDGHEAQIMICIASELADKLGLRIAPATIKTQDDAGIHRNFYLNLNSPSGRELGCAITIVSQINCDKPGPIKTAHTPSMDDDQIDYWRTEWARFIESMQQQKPMTNPILPVLPVGLINWKDAVTQAKIKDPLKRDALRKRFEKYAIKNPGEIKQDADNGDLLFNVATAKSIIDEYQSKLNTKIRK